MSYLSILLSVFLGFAPTSPERQVVAPPGTPADLPFSPAIVSGDLVYLSGAIPAVPEAGSRGAGIEEQTHQTFGRIKKTLQAAGLDFSDVVCSNVYLTDSRNFQEMNQVYRTYFKDVPPTRATVETDLALPGIGIEIGMVAARRGVVKKKITPDGWKTPASPYSWGVQAGDTLFISGMVSRNPETGNLVPGDVTVQTLQVLRNIGRVLRAAGMGYENVVSSKVYLTDARDFSSMNEVYRMFFEKSPPARATVRTRLMNPAMLVEIQCVAVMNASKHQVILADGTTPPTSPFSPSVRAGGRQFLAGMVGRGKAGYVPGDIDAQTRQTLANLRATLKAANLDFSHVLESTIYLTDVRNFGAVNKIYRELLPTAPPARTTVGAGLMSTEAMVEIMMTATAPGEG